MGGWTPGKSPWVSPEHPARCPACRSVQHTSLHVPSFFIIQPNPSTHLRHLDAYMVLDGVVLGVGLELQQGRHMQGLCNAGASVGADTF